MSSKWVIKCWRQLATSATYLTQKLIMNVQCSGGSRSFAKGMRALKMRSIVSSHWKLTVTNWEQSLKMILSTTQEVAEELSVDHSMVVWLLKPIGRVKKVDKWVPHELIENKKIVLLKHCLLLLYTTTTNHFSYQIVTCDKKGFYATSDKQLSGWTEKKLQSNSQSHTCTPRRSWSLFGGLLPVWSITAFWIPAKALHLRIMLSKLMKCTKKCMPATSVGQQMLGPARAQFYFMTTPDCTSHNQCSKSWMNWATNFCLICHIHLISCHLTTTSSSILTTFCRENASTNSRR